MRREDNPETGAYRRSRAFTTPLAPPFSLSFGLRLNADFRFHPPLVPPSRVSSGVPSGEEKK